MKRDDALWKGILEDLFDDFLRFFFNNADEIFDMNRPFEFLDKELEQLFPTSEDEFFPKYVDKLVKVFTKEGSEQWILVHIEVQGAKDKTFAQRMYTYHYRIWDKYQKPITAFAILTDSNKHFYPTFFEQELLGTKIRYDFNAYKVLFQNEKDLDQIDNPFAMVILTVLTALQKGKVSNEELFNLKINLAKRLLSKNITKEKIRGLMNFLKLYVRFGNDEFISKFDKEVDVITNKPVKTMGIEEFVLDRERRVGLKKGIEIANKKKDTIFVKNLLEKTDFNDQQIADIANVTLEFIAKIRKNK
ncbi:putative YhgA-like transposase [Arcicella aurantiaca]|uniref:Putative YhgA-like transposase n=1 Tax=Arcicella aurantiaca TaxID=591202 RepID=A0A316E0V4_9BACT|nr:Rpn family recombination-promoting nuclease/putative transposase [Arcicella aurantiaca]PWK23318.1 putative YhgA-like transposase [Arcicella aurantiaca]